MLLRNLLLGSLLQTTLLQGVPPTTDPPAQPGPAEAADGRLFSLEAKEQDVEELLHAYARLTGASITIPELPLDLISVHFKNQPLEAGLKLILAAGGLDFRKVADGYVVGLAMDLKVEFPEPNETVLDAVYRCKRISSSTLANSLKEALPDVKVISGPTFQSPPLANGSDNGGVNSQVKTIDSLGTDFRSRDVVITGPAATVRRALALARKFDRSRRQVRITVKIVSVNGTDAKNLGVSWQNGNGNLLVTATEQATSGGSYGGTGSLVDGLRLGKFNHSPITVSATLQALEAKGRTKTLANPTITLLDGERSFILSGTKYVYPNYTGKDTNGLSVYTTIDVKVGIYLQVSVEVGEDNDMILSLYPSVTSQVNTITLNGATYPIIGTSEEQTTVRAASGEVIVLGGLLVDNNSSTTAGLPGLSRIPVLGRLFSTKNDSSIKNELMIILTPELVPETNPLTNVKASVTLPGE